MIVLGIIIWYLVGLAGIVWAWTSKHDFTTDDIFPALVSAIIGPFATLIVYTAIWEPKHNTIFRARK